MWITGSLVKLQLGLGVLRAKPSGKQPGVKRLFLYENCLQVGNPWSTWTSREGEPLQSNSEQCLTPSLVNCHIIDMFPTMRKPLETFSIDDFTEMAYWWPHLCRDKRRWLYFWRLESHSTFRSRNWIHFSLWPRTLTCNLDCRTWHRRGHDKLACHISRSQVS